MTQTAFSATTISPEQLTLYISPYCPYCHRVLNALVELGFSPDLKTGNAGGIALKNTFSNRAASAELRAGGGKTTVPCLQINQGKHVQWMYESADIITYLKSQLAST